MAIPICATANNSGLDASGNRNWCSSGTKAPSKDGPRITPAIISPMTCGWCSQRRTSQPHSRQAARMTNICNRKINASELPGFETGAGVLLHEIRVGRQRVDDLRHVGAVLGHEFLELAVVQAGGMVIRPGLDVLAHHHRDP